MDWVVAAITEQEYGQEPFWATLEYWPRSQPVILGVSELLEPVDYDTCAAKFGQYHQFLIINEDAMRACTAAGIKLQVLGSIEFEKLKQPSLLLGSPPRRVA
jgi:hypothetical protein